MVCGLIFKGDLLAQICEKIQIKIESYFNYYENISRVIWAF